MTNDEVLQALAHLIGTPYTPSVKATIREITGRARVYGYNEIITLQYDPSRISIVADAEQLIEAFHFG